MSDFARYLKRFTLPAAAVALALVLACLLVPSTTTGSSDPQAGSGKSDDLSTSSPAVMKPYVPKLRFPEGLTLIYNGSRLSKIVPCGCRGRNLGGVHKEAHILEVIRSVNPGNLAVDAGGMFREFTDENLKLQSYYVMLSLKKMKYAAINIGYPDFRQGIDVLKKLESQLELPFLSANIIDSKTGELFFKPYTTYTVTLKSGQKIRVGVVGVTSANAGVSNPNEQVLPRKGPALEVPVQPVSSLPADVSHTHASTHPNVSGRWRIDTAVAASHAGEMPTGGAPEPAPASGGKSAALAFALDTTTPTLTRGMYEVKDEIEALKEYGQPLRDQVDVLVLLSFAGPQRSRQIGEAHPYFDVVIGGDSYMLFEPYFFGPNNKTLWVGPEHEGRVLGKVEIAFEEDGTIRDKQGEVIPIDQHYEEVSDLKQYIEMYKQDTVSLPVPKSQKTAQRVYAGANRCSTCHVQAMQQWQSHKHSHAMKALLDKKMEYNPDCLRCHTVAFGKPGGFSDLRVTSYLSNVQCENCHGPGQAHVDEERKIAAMKEGEKVAATRTQKMNMQFDSRFCMECHDPENDPHFDFALDIEHVKHTSTQPNRTRVTTSPMSAMR